MDYGDDFLIDGTGTGSGGYEPASRAFDKNTGTYAQNWNSCPWWLKYNLGSGVMKKPAKYDITLSNYGATYCPSAWKVWGINTANDCAVGDEAAAGWTELDSRTGITWSSAYERKSFEITNTVGFQYLRWSFTAPNGPICIGEIQAYELDLPPVAAPVNYLGTRGNDRMRTKGISLGEKVVADNNFSFLIALRDRLRTRGFSAEQACPYVDPWNPASLNGLLAWYAASEITDKADGNTVSQWDDLSGNSRHLKQATGSRQPIYKTGIRNSLPALLLDNSDDVMITDNSITGIKTVAVVAIYNGANFGSYNGLITGESGDIWMIGSAGGNGWYTGESSGMTWYKDNSESYQSVTNAWHCFIVTHPTGKTQKLQVGRDRVYDGRDWGGYIAEVILYDNVLSSGDRGTLDAYLRTKYAIS